MRNLEAKLDAAHRENDGLCGVCADAQGQLNELHAQLSDEYAEQFRWRPNASPRQYWTCLERFEFAERLALLSLRMLILLPCFGQARQLWDDTRTSTLIKPSVHRWSIIVVCAGI